MKIQDGCNYFCSYCIIPYLRGRVRSRKSAEVIKEVVTLEEKGYNEIVLSGINIGTYQDDKTDLTRLIEQLLINTTTVRFRLSSIEPNLITDEMIKLVKNNDRLCNYFHIPLQHGAGPVLKRMNRKYNPAEFATVMKRIRAEVPDICIGADAIVGFPGETDADFEQMADFICKMNFSYLHVFRYSKREGTKAATMKPQVPDIKKKERSAELRKLGEQLKKEYIAKFLNRNLTVLFEQELKKDRWGGNSGNFIYVKVNYNKNLNNQLKKVKITNVFNSHAEGEIIE
ncbi:MAG: MiaB/RimO family radical SAM methylthiotransferase [Fidelibacterota bacterium]